MYLALTLQGIPTVYIPHVSLLNILDFLQLARDLGVGRWGGGGGGDQTPHGPTLPMSRTTRTNVNITFLVLCTLSIKSVSGLCVQPKLQSETCESLANVRKIYDVPVGC